VACQHLIRRRDYLPDLEVLDQAYHRAEALVVKLQSFRRAIAPGQKWLRDEPVDYVTDAVSQS
jgi:hypothetical protein